ncbi:SKP1-like protein 1A-like [Trifolium pratense]|uniref:SKP1-like protein n=3 Tax=Trifolium pratense TaxID=57577 RepID=A0A2K3NXC4_TRIPR|nr:SKP1-like protein 1B [Trifolium pratense]XP_045795745.1 SKP1-like protein 1B [Trifolium pratense]PNY07692.1 SKP1-like protein 1A-like [Trifolium pratense]CAJ2633187.1 unnamed protein product [Trifolium pratense]CAJ2633194.1 unnamed protein product [Trifolium pratense]
MSSSSTNKKITLKSSDGQSFEVDEAVARESQTIKHVLDDRADDKEIPIPEVNSKILAKVIEYCKKHVEAATASSDEKHNAENNLMVWDSEFINVDKFTVFELIRASNYLDIKNLSDLSCSTVADMLRGKSTEEIREMFDIKNDFLPEEEAQLRRENVWAFE